MPIIEIDSNSHIPATGDKLYRIIDAATGAVVMETEDSIARIFVRMHPTEFYIEMVDKP